MRRRSLLTAGAIFALSGCTSDSSENGETSNDDADVSNENNQSVSGESTVDETVTEIVDISAPSTVEQGGSFDIDVTVSATSSSTVTAQLLDGDGGVIAEGSSDVDGDGETTVTVSLSIPRDAASGNSTLTATVDDGSTSDESTVTIAIAEVLEDWQRYYRDAEENVRQFLNDFSAVGSDSEDATILDTTLTDEFPSSRLSRYLAEADSLLGDARLETSPGTSSRKRIERLRNETTALQSLSDCQDSSSEAYSLLEDTLEEYRNDGNLNSEIDRVYTEAQDEFDEFTNLLSDLNPIVGSHYEEKADQLDSELDVLDRIIGALAPLFSARDAYESEFYGLAFDRAQPARQDFEDAVEDLEDAEAYPPTDQVNQEFLDLAEEWVDEADEIERSSSGRQTEDE
jgi:hypothetical protein